MARAASAMAASMRWNSASNAPGAKVKVETNTRAPSDGAAHGLREIGMAQRIEPSGGAFAVAHVLVLAQLGLAHQPRHGDLDAHDVLQQAVDVVGRGVAHAPG